MGPTVLCPPALRRMRGWDIAPVSELERDLFPDDAWPPEAFRSELAATDTRYYVVADEGGQLVGYAGLLVVENTADVQTLAVSRDRWGTGVGSRLLVALIDEAKRRGCRQMLLEVRADNERAKGLYRRFGFERVEVRRGYYQPAGVDGFLMRKSLSDG